MWIQKCCISDTHGRSGNVRSPAWQLWWLKKQLEEEGQGQDMLSEAPAKSLEKIVSQTMQVRKQWFYINIP